ncbi:unnamed protein product [Penicillium salamii]|uniref:Uncharacterized protein n=1 Tax=Penicillium salamii TaxID=1612424 RepID=A0A9W4JPR1_9EURO|nr:unnamed protein product [Penicillium salamii]CAG8412057.1 unnamed protein product [Penicillium salamii]CAG8412153.1 unnamed protein product [Penicillium salamii]
MRLWSILCLGSALALSIPNHELRLPFAPSPDSLENGVRSTLSINWSIQNGSLYANENQVYPPSVTMQLRAPLYEADTLTDKSVELSYTLDTRPLSTDQVGAVAGMVRVRVELLDLHGNLISPNAVAIDMLTYQDGDHHITRIRVEPARGGYQGDRFSQKSRPWVVKYWTTQFGSLFEKVNTDKIETETEAETEMRASLPDASAPISVSKFSISSFWAAPEHANAHGRHPHHRPGHSFRRIVRPIILPAIMGAVAGLAACLVGFFLGHLAMSFAVRAGWKARAQPVMEQGSVSEKSPMVPNIYVTDVTESV